MLAAFALKYAVFVSALLLIRSMAMLDAAGVLLLATAIFVVLVICSSVDTKKIVANISVLHMCMTMVLLLSPTCIESLFGFS